MGIKAYKQIEQGTVTEALLDAPLVAKIALIAANGLAIAAITNSVGVAGGIAPLNAAGVVPASHTGSIYLKGKAESVNSEAEMLALTVNRDGTPMEQGDRVDRLDLGRTMIYDGGGLTDPDNWSMILAENAAVTAVRNASGTVDETGVVTFSDIAFSGSISDLAGAAAVATSGAANDVVIADSGDLFVATDVEGALAENAQSIKDEAIARGQAISSEANARSQAIEAEANARDIAITEAKASATLVEGTVTGVQDDINNTFTISGVDTSKMVTLHRDGVDQLKAGFATISGSTITTTVSAPASDERLVVTGYPEAA